MPSISLHKQTVTRKGKTTKTRVWYMFWRDPHTGKQVKRSTKTRDKSVAKQIARETERNLLLDPFGLVVEKAMPINWDDFKKEFVEHSRATNRPNTADAYDLSLNHFGAVAKGRFVHEVNVAMLHDFVSIRRKKMRGGKPISAATINKDLRAIRAAMHFAVDRGYVTACPKFRSVMLREDKPAPVVVPQNDRQSIYDAVASEDIDLRVRSAAWWLVLLTVIDQLGVRRNEALGLKWADINFDAGEATVHAVSSKGRRYRTLPMSERLVAVLRDWKDAAPNEPTDAVLPWEKNTLRPFYDDWNRILEKAGLPQGTRVVPKHFRSTCGSELIEAGVPTVVVKDFLGHASVTTTESHYINTGSSLKKASEARERMNDGRRAG